MSHTETCNGDVGYLYMLLNDQTGRVVPAGNRLSKQFNRLTRKVAGESSIEQFQALKGMLFKELPQDCQPAEPNYVALISLDDPSHHLKALLTDLRQLDGEIAQMLMAVPANLDRFELITKNPKKLINGEYAKPGDIVSVETTHGFKKGVLQYRGHINKAKGTWFGVEFKKPNGDSDGFDGTVSRFKCEQNHAMFVGINKLEFDKANSSKSVAKDQSKAATKDKNKGDELYKLKLGQRVFVFTEGSGKIKARNIAGVLRYLQRPSGFHKVVAGVELDEKLPGKQERNQASYFNTRKLFDCSNDKYFLTCPDFLLSEEAYQQEKGDIKEQYSLAKDQGKAATKDANNGDELYKLELGQRVFTFIEGSGKTKARNIAGVLRYLQKPSGFHEVIAGVELDEKLPDKQERNQTTFLSQRKLFECSSDRYFLTCPESLLLEEAYQPEKGDIKEQYEILSQDEVLDAKGKPVLKKEIIKKSEFKHETLLEEQERLLKAAMQDQSRKSLENKQNTHQHDRGRTNYQQEPNVETMLRDSDKMKHRDIETQASRQPSENDAEDLERLEKHNYLDAEIKNMKKKMGFDNESFLYSDKVKNGGKFNDSASQNENVKEGIHKWNGPKLLADNSNEWNGTKLLAGNDPERFISGTETRKHSSRFDEFNKRDENECLIPINSNSESARKNSDLLSNKEISPSSSLSHLLHEDRRDSQFKHPMQDEDRYTHESRLFEHNQSAPPAARVEDFSDSLQLGSMVQVHVKGKQPLYGVIKWKGCHESLPYVLMAGLELETDELQSGTDGTFHGKRFFHCPPGRGFFCKISQCRPDQRFINQSFSISHEPDRILASIETIEGYVPPPSHLQMDFIGRNKGIQGHHNSCYLDATLFAMYAFSYVFDTAINRKRRFRDIPEYDLVQKILKEQIVNPLRKNGFVKHQSMMELRKCLNDLGNIGGFLNEEKDPEELINLLFGNVLNVDPFVKLRQDSREEVSHLYQIFAERNDENPLPCIQFLFESSFLTANLQLPEAPSVMILQMPRFGKEKLYKRIQVTHELDITPVLSGVSHSCVLCGDQTSMYCRECSGHFGWKHVYAYQCMQCWQSTHRNANRRHHEKPIMNQTSSRQPRGYPKIYEHEKNDGRVLMELFAVVCIKTSHYVSFAKCGTDDDENWVFFDSMADRHGGQSGYNIPEVTQFNDLKRYLHASPLEIAELHDKSDERILRLYEDASLCFYRNKNIAMYK